MGEIVERGAEAMRAKRRELIAQPLDRIWPDLMRTAIEALREPTDAMKAAGSDFVYEAWGDGPTIAREAWQANIDAALSSEQEK